MRELTTEEIDKLTEIAYSNASNYILNKVPKKNINDLDINLIIDKVDEGIDVDVDINIDAEVEVSDEIASKAVDITLNAVDKYIESIL
ncbi:MAG: DUF3194 domain-containing protein [Methanobacteriaceae archaeon]|nr:DUF3194 domain-containing protein [Methanobacteriaceae archaeon]